MNRFVPLLILLAIVSLFAMMMGRDRNPGELNSVLIGKAPPAFSLPHLTGDGVLTEADLVTGKPLLVNFFASWCVPCRAEHKALMELAQTDNVPIIGIAYKDKPAASRAFLDELGDPFTVAIRDESGRTGIDFGVTGVPETFLIDGNGRIRYRHWGPIIGDKAKAKVLAEIAKVTP